MAGRRICRRPRALAIAARASPAQPRASSGSALLGLKTGDTIRVTPDDTGRDPVLGRLVAVDGYEIVLRRRDERVGEINIHFPRAGFDVERA